MTIPAKLPLRGRRNAYFGEEWQFTVADPDTGIEAPVDLSGFAAFLQLRLYGAQPGSAKLTLNNVGGNIEGVWIIDPTEGRIQVLASEDTLRGVYDDLSSDVEPGADIILAYDLVLRDDNGMDDVWVEGSFTLSPGVTVDG